MKKIVITSGYFNPLHIGHINLFHETKKLGDFLVVIVNNDEQSKIKGSTLFMPELERVEIIKTIRYVDAVFLSVDKDSSVKESLKAVLKAHPDCKFVFANGGDKNTDNIPEAELCKEFKIEMVNNVGGDKIQGSSWLLNSINKKI